LSDGEVYGVQAGFRGSEEERIRVGGRWDGWGGTDWILEGKLKLENLIRW
jgi:hypothetical protein